MLVPSSPHNRMNESNYISESYDSSYLNGDDENADEILPPLQDPVQEHFGHVKVALRLNPIPRIYLLNYCGDLLILLHCCS